MRFCILLVTALVALLPVSAPRAQHPIASYAGPGIGFDTTNDRFFLQTGRTASTALAGNDPAVALALSAVQSAQLTSAISAALLTPVTTVSATSTAQTLTFPSFGQAVFDETLNATCTFSLAGGASGQETTIKVYIRSGAGGFSYTLPSGVLWANGTAPTPDTTAGHITLIVLSTHDAGTTIFGSY